MRLTENLENFGDLAVAFHDQLVGVEELVAVETRQVRANVGLTGRHGADEHDGARLLGKVLVHLAHLLRVDAGGLLDLAGLKFKRLKFKRLKFTGLELGVQLRLGCGARLNLGRGLGGVHRRDFLSRRLSHRFGHRNLHLAE